MPRTAVPSKRLLRIAAGVCAAILPLTLAACTGAPGPGAGTPTAAPSSSASPATGPTAEFTFGTAARAPGLDPALVSDIETYRVTRQILEGLVGVDQTTGQPTPLLATEWTTSEDGKAYTFQLRSDVTFQDGTPFDATAVCTNFNRWFNFSDDLRSQAPGSSFKGVFKAHADQADLSLYQGCTAQAPDSVRIDLTQAFTGFLQALTLPAFAISSPQALAEKTADVLDQSVNGLPASAYALHPVGTGPYVFAGREPDSITLSSNETYWGDRGQIGTVHFVTYDHPETRLQALLDGRIDAYDSVTVGNFDQLVKNGQQIIQRDPFSVMYLGINQSVPILQNVKVRQAIEMAVDKDTLIRRFFIDNTAKASQFVPPKLSGFNNNAPALGHNPAKAKEYLAEAGYNGEELKFYYPLNVARPYLPTPEKVYAEISRQLTAVGLNIKPVPVEWSDGYLAQVTSPGDHALHLLGWNGSYADPDNFVGPLFGENNGEFGLQDPQIFSKIARARGLPDGAERTAAYETINAQIAAIVPAVPIAFPISALALSDRVLSYPASPVLDEVFTKIKLKA